MNRFLRCRRARLETRRSGQAVVELALIAPILFLIIFGLVDFARAWSAHHVIADAAREGTRMMVVHDEGVGRTQVEAAIANRLTTARLNVENATISFNPDTDSPAQGEPVTVTIRYQYDFWILGIFMNWATGDRQVDLVSTITMRSE
jgi:Flp pilus assembly protein TadG